MQSLTTMILGIIITVLLFQDSSRASNHKHFTIQILEELAKKTKIVDLGNLTSTWFPNDANKLHENGKSVYKFQFFNCEKTSIYFDIDPFSGVIRVERRIDRDNICHLIPTCCPKKNNQCNLDLTIKSDDDFSHIIVLVIDIKDINDNSPLWNQNELVTQFSEGSEIGDSKSLTVALDNDVGLNGVSHYQMTPETKDFELSYTVNTNIMMYSNKEQLKLVLKQKMDREKIERYEFILTAFDGGNPSFNGSVRLVIIITDENDNSPIFEKNSYIVMVNENLPPNTQIVQVKARDDDSGMNGKVEYQMSSLTKPDYAKLFSVESNTGYIRVRWELDYEAYTTISLIIEANDLGNLHRGTTCTVVINIRDLNDNSPEIYFEPSRLTNNAKIIENDVPGKLVAVFSVQDKDSNENGKVTCHMDPVVNKEFSLDKMNIPLTVMYKITTLKSFDREEKSKVIGKIICFDEGHPRRTTTDSVSVGVEDVNDEAPYFSEKTYTFNVYEDSKPGTYLFTINATDRDEGINSLLSYSIFGKDAQTFSINKLDGRIYLDSELDRETLNTLFFTIKAEDSGSPKQITTANATIIVKDVNDNSPILPKVIHLYVSENHSSGLPIVQINVSDADEGLNSEIKIVLISETAKNVIKNKEIYPIHRLYNDIHKSAIESIFLLLPDGKLLIRQSSLDRETTVMYTLAIEAFDKGVPPRSGKSVIIIKIEDVNDCRPRFIFPSGLNNTVKIPRRTVSGSTVAQILAVDEDEGENAKLQYSFKGNNLTNELFLMHPDSGKITLQQTVQESHKRCCYTLIVLVKDSGNPSQEDTARLQILIEPLNTDLRFPNKFKNYNDDSNELGNEGNESVELKIHNNVVVIIVLISAAALFIILMSLATALLICRKFKRNRNYPPTERFQFKQNFKNWKLNVRKPFINKRQQTFIQDSNQVEPISDQSLIRKNINNEDQVQPNRSNKSNHSYFLNPLTLDYISNSSNDDKQDLSINLPKYSMKQFGDLQNEIRIPGMNTYLTFNRPMETELNTRKYIPDDGFNFNKYHSLSFNDPTKNKNDLYNTFRSQMKQYPQRFLSDSNV